MAKIPLYRQIQADIKKQIAFGSLRPGEKVPSETELAKRYSVSQITSKNALNGLVEEGFIYRIQGKGTFVASAPNTQPGNAGTTSDLTFVPSCKGTIGLILPEMATKTSQKLLNYIEKYVHAQNYTLLLHVTHDSITDEAFTINLFRANHVDGLIVLPVTDEVYDETILRLALEKFPCVLVDSQLKNIRVCSVTPDCKASIYEATKHLVTAGHQRISLIMPKVINTATEERIRWHEQFLGTLNMPIHKSDWCLVERDLHKINQIFDTIADFFRVHPLVTAAICTDAAFSQCAYYALRQIGKHIPDDFELITFDRSYLEGVPYITQNEQEMAKRAVQLVIEQINGKYDAQQVRVPTEFVSLKSAPRSNLPPYHLLPALN